LENKAMLIGRIMGKKLPFGKSIGAREIYRMLKDARDEADASADVVLVGDASDTAAILDWLREGARETFRVAPPGDTNGFSKETDLVIYTLSGSNTIGPAFRESAAVCNSFGLESMALIDSAEMNEAAQAAKQVEAELAFDLSPGRVRFFDPRTPVEDARQVLGYIVDHLGKKQINLAAALPCVRPLIVADIIAGTANENGVIGAMNFLPGTDMPLLTANQMRMVLNIAASHGIALSLRRARELLFVLGGGFTFREAARQVVGLVPVAGWAVKGAVAYSGTRTVGLLAHRYFEGLKE